jgi:hypothetical protein
MPEKTESIADDEELYRRIPVTTNWYDPELDAPPSYRAFRPTKYDHSGLSLSRASFTTPNEEAGRGPGRMYFIAVLRAGDVRAHGMEVVAKPEPENPGHAELPGLTYDSRRQTEEIQVLLAEQLCLRVEGPYPGGSPR